MNTAKTLTAILWAVVLLPSAGDALADDSTASRREAMRRFKEGMAAYGRGDFEQARLSLLQAYTVVPDAANLAWDLALAESKTHHNVDALRHFRSYLRTPSLTESERAQAQKHLDEATRETGHITVTAQPGTTVTLDGSVVHDTLADPIDTEPGAHVLEARKGAQSRTLNVSAQAGETVAADLRFPDEPPAAMPPASAVAATGEPSTATAPPASSAETPTGSGGASPTTRIIVTSAIGVGAVTSIVLGIVFSGQASSDGSVGRSLVAPCNGGKGDRSACTQGHDAAQSQATEKNVATGLYIGGGVLVGAAVASWFMLAPSGPRSTGSIVVPEVTPTSAGLALSGRF